MVWLVYERFDPRIQDASIPTKGLLSLERMHRKISLHFLLNQELSVDSMQSG